MPGAWLYCVAAPPDAQIFGLDADGGIELNPDADTTIGRSQQSEIVVRWPMIGGRRNSTLTFSDSGTWRYRHLGHGLPTFHNDHLLTGSPVDPPVSHGDVLGPCTIGDGRITFLFLESPGSSRANALPGVERALEASFPDRAPVLIAEVRRWFVSEPFAGAKGLGRVLHCALCGCFRRADRVVLVEAHRPGASEIRFQVLADSEASIESPSSPAMGLCEGCLADPTRTFQRADDADRLRADLQRALDAADLESEDVLEEVDRRFAFAQPRRGQEPCGLCGARDPEPPLRGCTGTICRACLHGASRIRHIRG